MQLKGSMVMVRSMTQSDLPKLVQWKNDPEIADLVRGAPIYTNLTMETKRFEKSLENGEALRLMLCTGEGESIGFMVITDLDKPNKKANLGMLIGEKQYWNRGLGSEAMEVILKHFFDNLGFNRIGLEVFEYNLRARHMYRKVGFVEEGIQRQGLVKGDKYYDVILMGITKADYNKKQSGD
ncbi:MAG: GNAT family N-acetyltransferase [Firmicutes bacterium]|nr:GNAT family N-acetyltransferase [Bacillota bacterium]